MPVGARSRTQSSDGMTWLQLYIVISETSAALFVDHQWCHAIWPMVCASTPVQSRWSARTFLACNSLITGCNLCSYIRSYCDLSRDRARSHSRGLLILLNLFFYQVLSSCIYCRALTILVRLLGTHNLDQSITLFVENVAEPSSLVSALPSALAVISSNRS